MKTHYIVLFLLCFVGLQSIYAQKKYVKKGDNLFKKEEYYQALVSYNKAEEVGEEINTSVKKRIANCYFQLNDMNNAYQEFEPIADELTGEDVLTFAMIYHEFPFYEEAIVWYEKAKREGASPSKVDRLIESCKWASEHDNVNFKIRVNPTIIFTSGQSFGIEYYKDGVVYSSIGQNDKNKGIDKTGKAFLDLYYSDLVDHEIQEGRLLSEKLQFPYHIGAISFTSDFNTMYYTRSVRVKGDSRLKIYKVSYDGNDWGKESELSFNSDDYDCVTPAVSPDDKFLYFVSNKKGGIGGKDIYKVERLRGGMYGKVVNIGSEINTPENEEFPSFSKDNKLYFSSDGHLGFGGLDIFEAELKNGKWANARNLLRPFNSEKDDFAYSMNPKNPKRGFLSSNRSGNGDQDVIFYVEFLNEDKEDEKEKPEVGDVIDINVLPEEKAIVEPEIKEAVVDLSMFPISFAAKIKSTYNNDAAVGVKVEIIDDATGQVVATGVSDANGNFNIIIPEKYKKEDQEFELVFSKDGEFNSKRMIVNVMEVGDINDKGISMTPIFNDNVLDDISGMVLYYDGDEILEESKRTLDRLASYLQNNPQIVVKLNTHSDARGSKLSNLMKTQSIGEKVEGLLQSKGVSDDATIPRGYGERYIVNRCKRGVLCSEEEQQKNKRIEVVVWRVNK